MKKAELEVYKEVSTYKSQIHVTKKLSSSLIVDKQKRFCLNIQCEKIVNEEKKRAPILSEEQVKVCPPLPTGTMFGHSSSPRTLMAAGQVERANRTGCSVRAGA